MKKIVLIAFLILPLFLKAQEDTGYKKRALEKTEIDILASVYMQEGDKAAVTGGVGTEHLIDAATDIHVSIPIGDDDVLGVNATISAYTSASSSNLDPWSSDDDHHSSSNPEGTPWTAASGASSSDVWVNGNISYSHYSDSRNHILSANLNFANEFDYTSTGAGVSYTGLFNEKNTELNIGVNTYFDFWRPQTPVELRYWANAGGSLSSSFFSNKDILDQNGNITTSANTWSGVNSTLVDNNNRNTYTFAMGISQIISENAIVGIYGEMTYQQGWLGNPMQRVYFADRANFYVGNAASIPVYTSPENSDVFQLADDIERLPSTRLKIPIALRFNYYFNENIVLNTYYRYYIDDWNLNSNTINAELAIKFAEKYTIYPSYRYYTQNAAKYYGEYEQLLSTADYYSSDNDLSKYSANQVGLGFKYNDILEEKELWRFAFKTFTVDYKYYFRNTGFYAHIVSLGAVFTFE